jgi:hypothetical protein
MPETRHRTVLEIGVDDRGLRQLAPTMERALNPKVAEAFEKSMERSTAALMKMVEQQTKLGKLLDEQARRASTRAREDDRRRREEERRMRDQTRAGSAQGSFAGTLGAHVMMRGNQLAGQMPYREGFLPQMLSAIPVIGPAFAGAVGGAMNFYQSFAAQQIARTRAFGATGIGDYSGLAGTGVRLGIGPTELPGMLAQLAQSGGVRGHLLRSIAPDALRMQTFGGIDLGASGALVNSVLAGTGGVDLDAEEQASTIITEGVAAGISAGLREARIGEALQQIGASVTQMRSQGIMLNVSETLSLMRGLGLMGGAFAGEAGVQAAQSITSGFAGAADRESAMSALAIRHRMTTHGEDYETAARAIESNPVEAFRAVMGSLSRFRGTRGFETMLRTQFQRLGINISREQAHQLANMSDDDLANMTGATGDGDALVQDFLARQRSQISGPLGTAQMEAGYEANRAGIGAGMAGTVAQYRGLELQMIRFFQPMVQGFAQGVMREVRGLFNAFQEGGVMGMLEHAMSRLSEVISGLPDQLRRAISDAVGLPTGENGAPMSAGDLAMDALDAASWALNESAASVLEFAGADPEGETVRSLRQEAARAIDRGAARRGFAGAESTDAADIPLPGGGAARVETTTRVIVLDEVNITAGR